jgi:hypothetical protein
MMVSNTKKYSTRAKAMSSQGARLARDITLLLGKVYWPCVAAALRRQHTHCLGGLLKDTK